MKILSFDIESTTGSHKDGSMCTWGYCLAEDGKILEQKDIVMRPHTKRYETKIKLHYEKDFIKSCPKFPAFYNEIKRIIESADVVLGFSVGNDVEFLNNACDIYNLPRIEYDFLDVQLVDKTVYKRANTIGLATAMAQIDVDYIAHRSDEDARATLYLLEHILHTEKLNLKGLLKKYNITLGSNRGGEVEPCKNGLLTKKEKTHLINDFVDKNFKHNYNYKGGWSNKKIAFSDTVKYADIDLFRRVLKKMFTLNARYCLGDSANIYVYTGEFTEKDKRIIENRENPVKLKYVLFTDFLVELGELPELNFDEDEEILRKKRRETKLLREKQRKEKFLSKKNG